MSRFPEQMTLIATQIENLEILKLEAEPKPDQEVDPKAQAEAEVKRQQLNKAAVEQQDAVLDTLKGMVETIEEFPAVAENSIGLPKGEVLVRFRLIPEKERSKQRSFYMMETKVWSDLFRVFAVTHPEKLAEDTVWTENQPGKKPVFHVNLHEAYWCARWMGGQLPSAKEWDTAAGFYLTRR